MKIYIICLFLLGFIGQAAGTAKDSVLQQLQFGEIAFTPPQHSPGETIFLLSGQKMYEVACIDGSYPFNNDLWSEQGIWCHPMKLLSAICFSIAEGPGSWEPLHAKEFTYSFHAANFAFETNNLHITREDVVAEREPALSTTFTFDNRSSRERTLTFRVDLHVDLRPSVRCTGLKTTSTFIQLDGKTLTASNENGSFAFGNGEIPHAFSKKDSVATLEYRITVPGNGSTRFPLLLTGANQGKQDAAKKLFRKLISQTGQIKQEKEAFYTKKVFREGTKFDCSDKRLTDAFYCAKANVLLNRCDHTPYVEHPFIRAGVPTYPRLFGTDFCFSAYGLLESGFAGTVRSTLLNMAAYSRMHLRSPHEISSDGTLLGWDHIQVTPQFIAACGDYYAWTSDSTFLKEAYPLCRTLLDDIQTNADSDKDLFIEGHGLMEESEFKGNWEELSSSAYLYPALTALAFMADKYGDKGKTAEYRQKAVSYKHAFNSCWWNEKENIWYCAFSEDGKGKPYNFWSVLFPQKARVAESEKGRIAMVRIENEWTNDTWGMVGRLQPERDQRNDGVGIVHNNLCATTAFDYGKEELGWKLLQLTTKGVFGLPHACLGLFPECQPGLCSNISQLWSYATFLESLLHGLAGISIDHTDGSIHIAPSFPGALTSLAVEDMQIGSEKLSMVWEKGRKGKIFVTIRFSGDPKQIKYPKKQKGVTYRLSK